MESSLIKALHPVTEVESGGARKHLVEPLHSVAGIEGGESSLIKALHPVTNVESSGARKRLVETLHTIARIIHRPIPAIVAQLTAMLAPERTAYQVPASKHANGCAAVVAIDYS